MGESSTISTVMEPVKNYTLHLEVGVRSLNDLVEKEGVKFGLCLYLYVGCYYDTLLIVAHNNNT